MSKIDCFGYLWYNDYNLGVVMDLKSVIKKYMDEIRTRFSKKKGEKKPTEASTGLTREQLKELEEKPYNEILSWVKTSMIKLEQYKNNIYVFENDDEKLVVYRILTDLRKYIHLFPAWKKAGVIEYAGDDFDKLVEDVNAQLYSQHFSQRINNNYTIKSLQEFLEKKKILEENLQYIPPSYLSGQVEQVVEYMRMIEDVLSNAQAPLEMKALKGKEDATVLSEKDSHIVGIYLNKIDKIQKELTELDKYFKRAKNIRDQKQLEDFLYKYSLHDNMIQKTDRINPETGKPVYEFLKVTPYKAFHESIAAMNQDKVFYYETFSPEKPEQFIPAISKLIDGVTFKRPESFDWENNLTEIIKETFVKNELFSRVLKGEEKITEENAKQIIQLTFDSIKEIISQSYLSLGIDLELNYADKAPMNLALGSNNYTPDMKSQITIYEDTLKTIIETQPSEVNLALILSTMFHETGHAVDTFWNKIAQLRPTSDKIKQLRDFVGVENLKQEDLFLLMCLSPSLCEHIQQTGSDMESINKLLKSLNEAEYYESREEHFARVTSADLTKLLYEQLALFYKDEPEAMKRLSVMYHTADKVAGTYYSLQHLEELDMVDGLTNAIFADIAKVPEDLFALENLCSDYEETRMTNQQAEDLNAKRDVVFKKFYSALSQENKELLLKRTLQEGRIFLLNSIIDNNFLLEIPTFETEDMIAYFRKIATFDFEKLPESHSHVASQIASFRIAKNPENTEKLKQVYSALAEDKNIDEMYYFLNSTNKKELVTHESLYNFLVNLPESEKIKENYNRFLVSMEFAVKYDKEDSPIHEKLENLIKSELERTREQRRHKKSNSTALVPIR